MNDFPSAARAVIVGAGIVGNSMAYHLARLGWADLAPIAHGTLPSTEVTGIDVESGRVRRVHTDKGEIETEYVFVCCGVWSPRIARMAGATIPLTPAGHQMISVGPIPLFQDKPGRVF